MATQGLLSVVQNDEVKIKIVTASDGYYIPLLKAWIFDNPDATHQEIYDKALSYFGDDSFLLQTGPTEFFKEVSYQLDPRWEKQFNNPNFNPRWDLGIAEYSETLDTKPSASQKKLYTAEARINRRGFDTIDIYQSSEKDGYTFLNADSVLHFDKQQLLKSIKLGTSPFNEEFEQRVLDSDTIELDNDTLKEIAGFYFPTHASLVKTDDQLEQIKSSANQLLSVDRSHSTGVRNYYEDKAWNKILKHELKREAALNQDNDMTL